jgi:phage terminase large subunit-like protein
VFLLHPLLAPWVAAFIAELAAFPTGANDDQVDGFSQLVRHLIGGHLGIQPASGGLAAIVDAQLGGYR